MNILIIGTGSIGMRHLQNCLTLNSNSLISVVSRSKTEIQNIKSILIYKNIEDAFAKNQFYDAVIVATPTNLHIENCVQLINLGIKKIYLEKPISNKIDGVFELIELIKKQSVLVFVGFDMRFDLGLNKVIQLLNDITIGNLISFQAEVGQYLPDWRPETDYKTGMSAKIALGGGVMLDLVHEFDYLIWILGPFKNIFGLNKKVPTLEIETEAISVNIIETQTGIIGVLSMDYLQKKLCRRVKFIGDNGIIEWDYVTSQVKWNTKKNQDWNTFSYNHIERNDRFITILEAFFDATASNIDPRLTILSDGVASLEAVLKAKEFNNLYK